MAVALLGLLAALAAPRFTAYVQRARVRAALDQLSAELYRARAYAATRGARVRIEFLPGAPCAPGYRTIRTADRVAVREVRLEGDSSRVCLDSNVTQAMSIDSRGMLAGSPRTIHARSGTQADSITISIAGRVYRW